MYSKLPIGQKGQVQTRTASFGFIRYASVCLEAYDAPLCRVPIVACRGAAAFWHQLKHTTNLHLQSQSSPGWHPEAPGGRRQGSRRL